MSDDSSAPTKKDAMRTIELSVVPSTARDALTPVPWFDGAVEVVEDERPRPPPPPPTTPTVRRTGPRLRDEGEIARGGMGVIRRVYDQELRRRVAMKELPTDTLPDSGEALRFLDEARITGLLDHPNIVPVHELLRDDSGLPRYTMKLVDGTTLTKLIAGQRTQRDLENLLEVLVKVCDALSFAHDRGVIHRDLKPDNVMVGRFGQVYVMDWGCAHIASGDRALVGGRVDDEGTVIGTLQYMAPEQAWGQISRIDRRTDVFALGAILYKMLTGKPPFPQPAEEALGLAQRCEITPPEELGGVAIKPPPHLSRIAMKAMAREPAERYQSAEELAAALREFLRGGNWFPLHKFPPGAVIVREGERADAAFILMSGTCEVRRNDASGRPVVVRRMGPGDVFGETAIFADATRSASVVAVEEVSAVVIDRQAVDEMMRSSWLGLFVKALATRFLELESRQGR